MLSQKLNVHKIWTKPGTYNDPGTGRTKCKLIEVPVAVEMVPTTRK
jgi:hypothetical protein